MSKIFNALRLNEAVMPETGEFPGRQTTAAKPVRGADGKPHITTAELPLDEWTPSLVRLVPVQIADAAALLSPGQSYAAEQYRIARTKIVQSIPKPFRLAITSPGAGDGKTLTAVNLAVALGLKNEEPTLLIDADLRRASVHKRLGVAVGPGVAEVLAGAGRLQDAIFRAAELPSLHVLPAGSSERNPTELLDSPCWRDLMDKLRRDFPQIIVDCPPVDVLADYDLIAAACDSSLLVLRPDHTNRALCKAAAAKLKPKLTGVLINSFEPWFLWRKPAHDDRYYYYGRKGGQA
jgi:capsular exopolysaccharide synthesis family protein